MKREYKASIWMKLWIKRIAGKKNILLLMLLFLILTIYLEPLKSFVSISGYKISPWVYPFLITDSNFLIIFMCGVICFFSNTIFFKAKDCYYFLRMGCNGIGVCNFKCRYDFGFKYYNDIGCTKYSNAF